MKSLKCTCCKKPIKKDDDVGWIETKPYHSKCMENHKSQIKENIKIKNMSIARKKKKSFMDNLFNKYGKRA